MIEISQFPCSSMTNEQLKNENFLKSLKITVLAFHCCNINPEKNSLKEKVLALFCFWVVHSCLTTA